MATYLLNKADNDNVRLFQIRGTSQPNDLRLSLLEMSLTSELTKSDKGLYHAQICPAYGEDKRMTEADWLRAVEIWEEETGFTGQKRALVFHEKNGRIHLHCVWECYDHERGIMKSDSFSRLAQDRARQRMEREFDHQRTSIRNPNRPIMKEYLTEIWQQTASADDFMRTIAGKGYVIASGTRRPFMVVDKTGQSFDLVRYLDGIITKEVRERFKTVKLPREAVAIEAVRKKAQRAKAISNDNAKDEQNREKVYTMQGRFQQQADQSQEQLKKVVAAMDAKEAKKKAIQEKIMQERLERAKRFRENEQDM
ncbi:relaxase/mobilization nuclease domain-containing protein [Chitinophaga barathri]|uniref:relaxase/mobilization nuclease domain-containing protein n=1 Tax=Chitinophaga barathri TaxID=1647451 RepID=UPI001F4D42D6|nr:relaxase [Chitinophaga barathri]